MGHRLTQMKNPKCRISNLCSSVPHLWLIILFLPMPALAQSKWTLITADFIRDQIKPAELIYWVFNDSCPPSPGCVTPQELPAPAKSGVAYAQVWQFVRSPRDKETARHCRGYAKNGNCYAAFDTAHKFHLDLSVATLADPSAPR